MPAKGADPVNCKLQIAMTKKERGGFERERLKRNLSQREALLLLMDKAGWHVSVRGRK